MDGFEENMGDEGVVPHPPPLPIDGFFAPSPEVELYAGHYANAPLHDNQSEIFAHEDEDGDGNGDEDGGPLLPDPSQMREQGAAFREWRRQNAIYLEEKEKKEKELRNQIIAEAEEYKQKFYEKRSQICETNKAENREREKVYHGQQEKFHKDADQHFWKAVAEMIPREVPNIEKRRGKKDDNNKKPSVVVVDGPKPGKPTDMSRMRQMLMKLKTKPPPHMMPPPPKKEEGKNPSNEGKEQSKEGKDDKKSPEVGEEEKNISVGTQVGSPVKPVVSPVKEAHQPTPKTPKPDEASANSEDKASVENESPSLMS
ncbi:Clathrin light chain 1 [Striga hermonthica]|uniref:Clathrin light chain n=1 Tax=Striga hermonthica TaxID=68872 RepID=A0A9N7R848_STRHE|nr:Clathrin light chain 1 [Striga hermonthica]